VIQIRKEEEREKRKEKKISLRFNQAPEKVAKEAKRKRISGSREAGRERRRN
jgi:hypothetical protein